MDFRKFTVFPSTFPLMSDTFLIFVGSKFDTKSTFRTLRRRGKGDGKGGEREEGKAVKEGKEKREKRGWLWRRRGRRRGKMTFFYKPMVIWTIYVSHKYFFCMLPNTIIDYSRKL